MKIATIETGKFKLDGGAMFGVVPKTIWNKTNPADESNLIDMAMRCLLIEDDGKIILIDNGLGHKYNEKFAGLYKINHEITLDSSLEKQGLTRNDITDVILTHLHFDHCGGSTNLDSENKPVIAFPNAKFWVQKKQWKSATNPNAREKASFFDDNLKPLTESGQLHFMQGTGSFSTNISLKVVNGHTDSMQLPLIQYKNQQILYAADLIPTFGHIPLPYVMGYDVRPLTTLIEKEEILKECAEKNIILFYEHDAYNECGTVKFENDKYSSDKTFKLSEII